MYEQNSFDPVARVVQLSEVLEKQRIAEKILYIQQHVPSEVINQDFYHRIEQAKTPLIQIYHYHCNHLGTPQELTNQDGDVIWLSYDRAWGGSFDTIYKPQFVDNFALDEFELQPIKFQGQSLDTETGLHYNRFRYYDSDVGMFISRDPIGLLGGNNVFQYAPNPIGWIDPWGLATVDAIFNMAGESFYGVNPTERSNRVKGDTLPGLAGPNSSRFDMHAEIDAMIQSYDKGHRGGTGILTVEGKDICRYCKRSLKNMAQHLELDEFIIHEKTTGNTYKFNGTDLNKVREGGKGFKSQCS